MSDVDTNAAAAPANDAAPPRISQKDALNFFSMDFARRMKDLIDRGVDEKWFEILFADHTAALIARREPRHLRERDLEIAVERLRSFTATKVAQRRRDTRRALTGKGPH